jgi:hypothetical protein
MELLYLYTRDQIHYRLLVENITIGYIPAALLFPFLHAHSVGL